MRESLKPWWLGYWLWDLRKRLFGPTDWEEDCWIWWGRTLTGKNAHWCPEWDELPIDDTLPEAKLCPCYERSIEELRAIPGLETPAGEPTSD